MNNIDDFAKTIKYVNIPEFYIFNKSTKTWVKRKNNNKDKAIGRLCIVSPKRVKYKTQKDIYEIYSAIKFIIRFATV